MLAYSLQLRFNNWFYKNLLGGFQHALVIPVGANGIILIFFFLFFDETFDGKDFSTKHNTNELSEISRIVSIEHMDSISMTTDNSSEFIEEYNGVNYCCVWEDIVDIRDSIKYLPVISKGLIIIHTVYILVFHVIINYIPYISVYTWHFSAKEASILAAIPSIIAIPLCPVVGLFVTYSTTKKLYCFACGVY